MTVKAVEMRISPDGVEPTGNEEVYSAETIPEAIESFIYTRKLKNGNFQYRIGETGRVLYPRKANMKDTTVGWTFTLEKVRKKR